MRNLLLVLIYWLISTVINAQKISPYYPNKIDNGYNVTETQMTYIDLNFVNSKVQKFIYSELAMQPEGEPIYNNNTITEKYTEMFASNREPKELYVSYKVFTIDSDFVVESVKITGDKVVEFYVRYWSTNLNFEDTKGSEVVSNRYVQDRITYNFNNGNRFIFVENTSIKDKDAFIEEFKSKRNEQQEIGKCKIKNGSVDETIKTASKTDKLHFTEGRVSIYGYRVVNKKGKVKYELKKGDNNCTSLIDLGSILNERFKDKKSGNYTVTIKLTTDKSKVIDIFIEDTFLY